MFTDGFLQQDMDDMVLEIERRCVALQLDYSDEVQVQLFVQDMFQNIDLHKHNAASGDVRARNRVEIYGLSMLMHDANQVRFGLNYLSKIDELSKLEGAWTILAKAMWRELESRGIEKENKGQS